MLTCGKVNFIPQLMIDSCPEWTDGRLHLCSSGEGRRNGKDFPVRTYMCGSSRCVVDIGAEAANIWADWLMLHKSYHES